MTPVPFARMTRAVPFCGPIAFHFSARPALHDVAGQIIDEQWRLRAIAGPAPSILTLHRALPGQGYRIDDLADVLIERFCSERTLNLQRGVDFLSLESGAEFPRAADVDLQAVECLLNECGPLLIEVYKQALVDFWTAAQAQQPPGPWLATYLLRQCVSAATLQVAAGTLDSIEAATAQIVAQFPEAAQRARFDNVRDVDVWLLAMDIDATHGLDPDLASAVLIERHIPGPARSLVLLYTLSGRLYRFDSRAALVQSLAPRWGSEAKGAFTLSLYKTSRPIFVAQAELLCEQQLELVESLGREAQQSQVSDGPSLAQRLDEASSLIELCAWSEHQLRVLYRDQLPAWLRQAPRADRLRYAWHLVQLAELERHDEGRSFLEGIPDASGFAMAAVREAILGDHPDAQTLDLDDIELINRQVTAVAAGSGGDVSAVGTTTTVQLNLAQFALANLAALRSGSVTLQRRSGAALPDWMSLDYLKALVVRLDVGRTYPLRLRHCLLDDAEQRGLRQKRFCAQVSEQLPLLALELHLRDAESMSAEGVVRLRSVFQPAPGATETACVRPLAFISQAGVAADVACNAYLIEGLALTDSGCLLYRPLHRQPLLEFASREALFQALCADGPLQDDVLSRLEQPRRALYAHGGFAQPHVVRFALGDEFAPLSFPGAAKLATAVLSGNVLEHFYRASVQELIERAEVQSVSSSESRWLSYEELGWLMFNTLLPFFNGPVALAGWMLPLFDNLRGLLTTARLEKEGEQMGELLLNLAFLLFSEHGKGIRSTPEPALPEPALSESTPVLVEQSSEQPGSSPSAVQPRQLDFSWSSINQRLSERQRSALEAFRRDPLPSHSDTVVMDEPHLGLYRHDLRCWVALDGAVYEVTAGPEGVRMIDAQGNPGPWLREAAPGQWQLDLRLRLRGGMPLNRRIAQMREAKRERLATLERERIDVLGLRLNESLQLRRDLDAVADTPEPSQETLQRYQEHLRSHEALLLRSEELYKELNQLQPQTDYNRHHSRDLFDRGANIVQLMYVLRVEFKDNHRMMRGVQLHDEWLEDPQMAPLYMDRYDRMMTVCRLAKSQVEELLARHGQIAEILRQLKALPGGGEVLADLTGLMEQEPPVSGWISTDLGLQGALVLDADRGVESHLLYSSLLSVRLGLQMQESLNAPDAFSEAETLEVLDSIIGHYVGALELAQGFQAGGRTEAARLLLDSYLGRIEQLKQQAEASMAERLDSLPARVETVRPSQSSPRQKHVLIRTRNRGVIVGARRKAEGSHPEAVVVLDPIDNSELARYEETTERGIWQPVVAAAAEQPAPSLPGLATLLKRGGTALATADRQLARARSQARTAAIGVEMEEILARQAIPLETLVQQVELALTRENAVDDVAGGRDAAIQAGQLTRKAAEMRQEGRRLRIAITKAQPPTIGHVSYLVEQGEVLISRVGERVALARRKGFAQDFLQEYVIQDGQGQPLWYAHFHYASLEAQAADFTAGHLKTREQRFDRAPQLVGGRNSQAVIQVYRSRIDRMSAATLFFVV